MTLWYLRERGDSIARIAKAEGISESYCRKLTLLGADHAAALKPPRMRILMNGHGKDCIHEGPILPGDDCNCVDCDRSGYDHTGALQPHPIPKPEPKLAAKPEKPLNRKARRAEKAVKRQWIVALPTGMIHEVKAFTKSEARGMVKKLLGIAGKGCLPPGTVCC